MTWKELLERDAERRAKDWSKEFNDADGRYPFKAGAQLPNERLLKLIEALQAVEECGHSDECAFLNPREDQVFECECHVDICTNTLADLRAELEKSV